MARMMTTTHRDRAPRCCRYGCCETYEMHTHGGRREPRVRRWTRAADNRAWRRDVARER